MSDNVDRPEHDYPRQQLTGRIIAAFLYVHRALGYGFSESVYRRALAVELQFRGIAVGQEVQFEVVHRGVVVGVYRADLVAESCVVLETKTGLVLDPVTPAQTLSYLRASRLEIGLILHFGPRPTVKRMVMSEATVLDRRRTGVRGAVDPLRQANSGTEDAGRANAKDGEKSNDAR